MLGAGIVLVVFGALALLAGRSLDGGGSDAFALAGLVPMIVGIGLLAFGAMLILGGVSGH